MMCFDVGKMVSELEYGISGPIPLFGLVKELGSGKVRDFRPRTHTCIPPPPVVGGPSLGIGHTRNTLALAYLLPHSRKHTEALAVALKETEPSKESAASTVPV